jgi:hypothetical protein
MIQNGQEFGEDHWIPEQDDGSGRRVRPRALGWKLPTDNMGRPLWRLYQRLMQIRRDYPGLRSRNFYPDYWEEWQTRFNPAGFGVDTGKQVLIYHRWGPGTTGGLQRFYIVLNFSAGPQRVSIPFPENGPWTDLLSDYSGVWTVNVEHNRLELEVGAHWGHIFFRES